MKDYFGECKYISCYRFCYTSEEINIEWSCLFKVLPCLLKLVDLKTFTFKVDWFQSHENLWEVITSFKFNLLIVSRLASLFVSQLDWLININSASLMNNSSCLWCICNNILHMQWIHRFAKIAKQVLRIEYNRIFTYNISSIEWRYERLNFESK